MQTAAKRPGLQKITVCTGAACSHRHGSTSLRRIKELLHIRENPVSRDGKARLDTIACSGNCHMAPLIMLNNTTVNHNQIETLPELIHAQESRSVPANLFRVQKRSAAHPRRSARALS
ncbi:MAG: NAD(P)H-dependent oxidoreductase subunit E [Spirochaetes bacterium]|nr:NAD(P)H-dependent oxidoreductase subunit E [Spirochaetota bacterium]MBX3723712.1 NAD(P)H-dependent oxidoreductase subunit E [Turneriella sp.]